MLLRGGESVYFSLRILINCRFLGFGLDWALGVSFFFFMMDLRTFGGSR